MNLQFVESGKIDKATRQRIRSHVMKGKNVGKIRPLGPRPIRKSEKEVHLSRKDGTRAPQAEETSIVPTLHTIGDFFSTLTFPCPMQPNMRKLIYQFLSITTRSVYRVEICLPADITRMNWFQYLMSDKAFFYSVLASSETAMSIMLDGRNTSPQALQYLSNTYICINENLQKDQKPTDGTIAAVMSMAIHEDLQGNPDRSKLHIDALERLIELRGGLTQLEDNIQLQRKICMADIKYALYAGIPPRFYRDEFPYHMIEARLCRSIAYIGIEHFRRSEVLQLRDTRLQPVVIDLIAICCLVNDEHICFRLEPREFQEVFISVSYRLLHEQSFASDAFKYDEEGAPLHLGLLAFMTTLTSQYSHTQRIPYKILAKRLRSALECASTKLFFDDTFIFWLFLIGGISVFGAAERTWCVSQVRKYSLALNIETWQAARERLTSYPWIYVIHDNIGQDLWQESMKN